MSDDQWTSAPDKPDDNQWSSEPDAAPGGTPQPAADGKQHYSLDIANLSASPSAGPPKPEDDAIGATIQRTIGKTLDAFGQGWQSVIGSQPLGSMSTEDAAKLDKIGVGPNSPNSLARAAWQTVIVPAAGALDIAVRAPSALYKGLQEGGMAAGVPRDIVSIPDAFMGSPHQFSMAKPVESAVPSPIKAISEDGIKRSDMAATGDPQIDAILKSPGTSEVINNPLVDRSHSVPYTAGGSVPLADPTIYIDHRFPKEIEAPSVSDPAKTVKFDPAEPFTVHENVEQHTMELLTKGGMEDASAYRVAHYEFAEKAEGAWYRANDIDQTAAEKIYEPIMDRIQKGADDKPPENLYEKPYPHDNEHMANGPDAIDHRPTADEIATARKILGGDPNAPRVTGGPADTVANSLPVARDLGLIGPERAPGEIAPMQAAHGSPLSRDVMVDEAGKVVKPGEQPEGDFYGVRLHGDHGGVTDVNDIPHDDIEITHNNGVPVERPRTMASDTGVPKDATISEPAGGRVATDKAGNIRMDLIDRPEAVLDVMRKAAEENGGADAFSEARRGQIPLGQAEAIADAMGVDVKSLDLQGIGRKLQNDGMVRTYIKAMIQSAENVSNLAKQVALNDTPENLIAFQEARMRHSVIQEQVAGLTAEWGRTGNVFQEFSEAVKGAKKVGAAIKDETPDARTPTEKLDDFLAGKKGEGVESVDKLRDMAKTLAGMDPSAVPKMLAEARKQGFFDKLFWWRNNSLISGWVTHSKYILVNTSWMLWNSLVVRQAQALIGDVRSVANVLSDKDIDRVYHGESAVEVAAMVRGFPTSIMAAARAFRDGAAPKLEGEVVKPGAGLAQGVGNPFESSFMHGVGEGISVPGRVVTSIHTTYLTLGQRMSIEGAAYRQAAKDGAKPWTMDFWQRQADHAGNPSPAVLDQSVKDAYYGAFMQPLGEKGKSLSRMIGQTPLRWLVPFRHVPANLLKAGQEMTPLALASKEMRDNMLGKNGSIARDTQIARLGIGTALGAFVVHGVLSDQITGDGPVDQKARAEWLLSHQPNSIRVGDRWVSYARLGPIGDVMGLFANLGEIAPHIKDGDYSTGLAMTVVAGGRWVTDGAGLLGLADTFDLMKEPERRGASITANFFQGFRPYSSLLNQTGAFFDPNMRAARSFVDNLRLGIPGEAGGMGRESLPVKRDWLGNPVANPMQYSLLRQQQVNSDPLSAEMQRLDIQPTLPERMINKVKLGPQAYDRFQVLAGAPLSMQLHSLVNTQGWDQIPDGVRANLITETMKGARERAAAAMKMENYGDLVQAPIEAKVRRMTGQPPAP